MTIMTPIEGITAPAIAAAPLTETFVPEDDAPFTPLTPSQRADGWTVDRQRRFLEALAEGHAVEGASRRVGLSVASAYAFRRSAKGAAFALGWRAATLVARDAVADTLMVRALEGTVDTIVRGETVITRHKFDNRLALSLLNRLDRQVEAAPDPDSRAARLVAQDFDAFLAMIEQDDSPARAGLFLARRGGLGSGLGDAGADGDTRDLAPVLALAAADRLLRTGVSTAGEVAIADLDPARRHSWTAEQWTRAEAAGLVALAPPAPEPEPEPVKNALSPQHPQHITPEPFVEDPVWWDDEAEEWRTAFPPAGDDIPDFEECEPGHRDYQRSLSADEAQLMGLGPDQFSDAELAALVAERDAYFNALADEPEIPLSAEERKRRASAGG